MAERARVTGQSCTYETIRAETGISLNTLSTIANDKARRIGTDVLGELLYYFDCEPNDLIVVVQKTEVAAREQLPPLPKNRQRLLKTIAASRLAYQSGEVQRGTPEELLATLVE
jgi:DNA-binding Xre family transcriptional regulator